MRNYKLTKYTCYFAYVAMASIFCLPPMLFVTFRETFGISYTLLGTLVAINFCTQLSVDLLFSFFSKHFNTKIMVRIMPVLTTVGLLIYALVPSFAPDYAYLGLVIGTVIFSLSAGLSEVMLSPIVAALPSDNPGKDMSLLHSLYAWGVLTVVGVSSIFFAIVGQDNWMYLTVFWALLPIVAFVLFSLSPIPDISSSHDSSASTPDDNKKRRIALTLCVLCIFLGSAAENVMTNWISAYMESALGIPKAYGDIVGLALFAILLGLGRTLYAKFGKNIINVLTVGMIGAAACYLIAGLSPSLILSAIACVLTGLCTSMLWPGTLIMMEERVHSPGVVAYAMMAAGGDFGASIAPQALGIIVDTVSASAFAATLSEKLSISTEQIGMKAGMLTAAIFPIIGVAVVLYIKKYFSKQTAKPISET